MSLEELTDEEIEAVRYAVGDFLNPYFNPMIAGPEPSEKTKDRLVNLTSAYLKIKELEGPMIISMGGWQEEVELDKEDKKQ